MDLSWQTAITIAGPAIAAYMAGLKTYAYISERRLNVTVKLTWGIMGYTDGISKTVLIIEAINKGERPVTLSNEGFMLPDKKNIVDFDKTSRDKPFPCELARHKNCTIWMDLDHFIEAARLGGYSGSLKVVGWVSDTVGNQYKSDPLEVDLNVSPSG